VTLSILQSLGTHALAAFSSCGVRFAPGHFLMTHSLDQQEIIGVTADALVASFTAALTTYECSPTIFGYAIVL